MGGPARRRLDAARWTRLRSPRAARGVPSTALGATEPADPIRGAIGTRTWDDGFECVEAAARFTVRGGDRAIAVEFTEGFRVAQLFAPPGEDYICIEPMTAPANALVRGGFEWVARGERRRAAFRIVCA